MSCAVCDKATPKADDFCADHWRLLPRWARQELVALKKLSRRGGNRALDYLKAVAVARKLSERADSSAAPADSSP